MLHLRPRGTRWLPEPVRRSLLFWRRSIQARVVVSTVLLSVAVISVVGWYLLQQVQDGLLDHRVDADVAGQKSDLVDPIIVRGASRGFYVVLAGPTGPGGRIADGGVSSSPSLDTSSVPTSLEEHFEQEASTAWTYTTIRTTDAEGVTSSSPGIVVGSQILLPA